MITSKQIQQLLDAQQNDDFSSMLEIAETLLKIAPQSDFLLHAKAIALFRMNKNNDAVLFLKQAIKNNPNDLQLQSNLAMILTRGFDSHNHWNEAKQILEKLPATAENIARLAVVYWRFLDWKNAKNYAEKAININISISISITQQQKLNADDYAEMLACLSESNLNLRQIKAAESYAHRLIEEFPDKDGHFRLGQILAFQRKNLQAIEQYKQAIKIQPENFMAIDALIYSLNAVGECDTAYLLLNNYLKNFNQQKIQQQKFLPDLYYFYARKFFITPYYSGVCSNLIHTQNIEFKKIVEQKFPQKYFFREKYKKFFRKNISNKSKLKIGFVSADLRNHAVAKFLLNLFPKLKNNANFELFAYSACSPENEDEVSQKLKTFCKVWKNISSYSDEVAAETINKDEIQILFDLSGHTDKNRLGIFALKPAPIQISWIGWLGTTGIPTMDYFLADEFCVPSGEKYEQQFSEKVLRMPNIWEVLTPPDFPQENQKNFWKSRGNENFTFASFNNLSKVNSKTLDLWCEVLKKSPENNQFIWLRGDFSEVDLQEKFLAEFSKRGVNKDQILLKNYENYRNYLQTILGVDLILDSVQFSGMTTTAEALSLGTPTITMLGDLMPSRLSGSCINAIGDENLNKNFIFDNENDFVNQAVFFANNKAKLNELTNGLAEKARKSPLCDAELFAKNFEIKMLEVWNNFLQS